MQVPDESRMHGYDIDGSVQDCSISSANALEIPQSRTEPSIWIDGSVEDCCISSANALEILQSYTEPSMWSYLISSRHDPEDQTNESRECESLCVMAKVGKI